MARKQVIYSFKMAEDVDSSSSFTSEVTHVAQLDKAAISFDWQGFPDGEIFLEGAQDNSGLPNTPSVTDNFSWFPLSFGVPLLVTPVDPNTQIVLTEIPFTHLRFRFVPSGSIGQVTATLTAKTVGS